MFPITEKRTLAPSIYLMKVVAPKIARKRKAGQFVILRLNETGERFPLTIVESDDKTGTITIIFQAVGKSTIDLARFNVGESILDVAGPLGKPTHIEDFGHVVCIGGGVGIAPLYPIVCAMKDAGNRVTAVISARAKELLILESEMRTRADELKIATDDGSYGFKGFPTQVLEEMISAGPTIDLVVAIGPVPMMAAIAEVTRPHRIKTVVSLNPIMVDGTGMCGGCRVLVGGETKFACVDGPEFDGHQVDFDLLAKRLRTYHDMENQCRLNLQKKTQT
ncbi:MAG: sulfide/dihydroorotate dehydrogenase-like FAD/NAD-binding protein [Alphaproteobacteria bacterium]